MTFEPTIAPAAPDGATPTPTAPTARFTLEHAPFAGQSFAVTFRVCGNPCCPCGAVGFVCRPEAGPDQPVRFDLDVFDRQINTQTQSAPDGVALARAFLAEAQDAQWEWLGQLFLTAKRRQMETMDLDTLAVDFPADVKAGGGTMLGYVEIFPWAETLKFTRAGEEWFADDQHCVRPGCTCTETGLAFFRVPPPNPCSSPAERDASAPSSGEENQPAKPLRCVTFLHHDYVTGTTSIVEAQPGSPAPAELLLALRAAHPNFLEMLRHRHGHLKRLGHRLMPKTRSRSRRPLSYLVGDGQNVAPPFPATPTPSPVRSQKSGRNDPCPCGSGKKFKKCCGAA